jgi:hypothetical protein
MTAYEKTIADCQKWLEVAKSVDASTEVSEDQEKVWSLDRLSTILSQEERAESIKASQKSAISQKSDLNDKKQAMLNIAEGSHLESTTDHVESMIKLSMDPTLLKEELAMEAKTKW